MGIVRKASSVRRTRKRIIVPPYVPEWEGTIKGWAAKFAHQIRWRVPNYIDEDDLLCEFYAIFLRVDAHYTVYDAANFMSLFQVSCRNRVHDLSTVRTSAAEVSLDTLSANPEDGGTSYDIVGHLNMYTDSTSHYRVAVHMQWLRPEVRVCVEYFLDHDRPRRLDAAGRRETSRDYYARVARMAWEAAELPVTQDLDFDVLDELLNLTHRS